MFTSNAFSHLSNKGWWTNWSKKESVGSRIDDIGIKKKQKISFFFLTQRVFFFLFFFFQTFFTPFKKHQKKIIIFLVVVVVARFKKKTNMTEQETKEWKTAVMKASLNFSTLCVELEHAASATGSLTFAFDEEDDTCCITVKATKDSKLLSLDQNRIATRHVRGMLLYAMDLCISSQESGFKTEEPVKKRGRGGSAATVTPSIPRMRAFYLNTPLTWDNVSTSRTIEAIVAFLE